MSSETVTKRLHVGGITPNITASHIKDRFASFGKVQTVEDLADDALGQKRPFTFLTIETTPAQFKKCLNIMSGSMWRGTQLRISEAKPAYTERLAVERATLQADVERQAKKRKRGERAFNMATGTGKEAQDMRPVTTSNYTSKKFWISTPTGHLIRSLAMRPCHTLPPSSQEKTSRTIGPRPAPTRARRRVINPSLWAPTHLSEATLVSKIIPTSGQEGTWVWEETVEDEIDEVELEDTDTETTLIGKWTRMVDGEVVETQLVRQKRNVQELAQEEESEMAEEELDADESDDELFAPREIKEDSPLFGQRDEIRDSSDVEVEASLARSPSPLFGTRQAGKAEFDSKASSSRSPSPLFGVRAAADTEVVSSDAVKPSTVDDGASAGPDYNSIPSQKDGEEAGEEYEEEDEEEGTSMDSHDEQTVASLPIPTILTTSATKIPPIVNPAVKAQVVLPDPLRKQLQSERSRDLSLLDSILSTSDSDLLPWKPIFGGFAESDDEDEEDNIPGQREEGVLRLRGGAPDEDDDEEDMSSDDSGSDSERSSSSYSSSDSSSSSSGSSGSSSDSESDDDDEEEEEAEGTKSGPATNADSGPSSRPLKAMFAPTAQSSGGGGFSLMASLDPNLELDELDVPLAPSVRPAGEAELAPLETLHPTSTVTGLFDPDPSIPLFFPSAGTFTDNGENGKKGKDGYTETMQNGEWRGFWRAEGETDEMMKEIWNRDRGELTKEWKKRHREAKKHRRRRGGIEEDQ